MTELSPTKMSPSLFPPPIRRGGLELATAVPFRHYDPWSRLVTLRRSFLPGIAPLRLFGVAPPFLTFAHLDRAHPVAEHNLIRRYRTHLMRKGRKEREMGRTSARRLDGRAAAAGRRAGRHPKT